MFRVYAHSWDGSKFITLRETSLHFPSLRQLMEKGTITTEEIPEIIRQVVKFVCFLRSRGAYHGQLFAHNLYYADGVIKVDRVDQCKLLTISPEGYLCYPPQLSHDDSFLYIDLWSIGILTFQLYMGRKPDISQLKATTYTPEVPPSAIAFINGIL